MSVAFHVWSFPPATADCVVSFVIVGKAWLGLCLMADASVESYLQEQFRPLTPRCGCCDARADVAK